MKIIFAAAFTLLALVLGHGGAVAQGAFGTFEGEVVARFLRDGRNMQLDKPFSYIDPSRRHWDVPAGMVTDGASIPRVLWTCCPPFTGKYRMAAVIHDYYCQTKTRSWQETHIAFYNAMRAADVSEKQAKVMFSAVYQFGPRWRTGDRKIRAPVSAAAQQKAVNDLKAWIDQDNPDLADIMRRVDAE